jgi:hypothetical protein
MYTVSLTSIPPRYPTLRPVLESLLAQRPAPTRVLLNVASTDGLPPTPPGVQVVRVPEDLGPITKVYYTLLDPTIPPDGVVLVCDDDCVKPQGWAQRLLGGVAPGIVASFASIVFGAYGFAFAKCTLAGVPALFGTLPSCARKIDDDVLTLYCVLNSVPICKLRRGPVSSVCSEIPISGPRLVALTGRDARPALRAGLAAHVLEKYGLYFDLRLDGQRERTWATHPATFGAPAARALGGTPGAWRRPRKRPTHQIRAQTCGQKPARTARAAASPKGRAATRVPLRPKGPPATSPRRGLRGPARAPR